MEKGFKGKIIALWISLILFILGTIACILLQEPLLDIVRDAIMPSGGSAFAREVYFPKDGQSMAIPFYMILCIIIELIYAFVLTNVCSHEEKWTNWSTAKKLLIRRIIVLVVESSLCYVYMYGSLLAFKTFFHPLMDTIVSVVTCPCYVVTALMILILIIQIMIRAGKHRRYTTEPVDWNV